MSKRFNSRAAAVRLLLILATGMLAACATAPKPEPEVLEISEATRVEYSRALELMRSGDYESAIDAFRGISERNERLAGPHVNIGIAHRALGQPDEARAALTTAIERDPANGAAYNQLGLLHRHAGRFDEARSIYLQGIDEDPDYAMLYRNLGILCDIYLQDPSCALENFRAYQELTDQDNETVERWIADVERRVE
jgi:tetratricopeptide (TPR) repeat protein